MFKWFDDFLAQSVIDYEAMKRGTYAGFLPVAIMGAAMLAKKLLAKKGQMSAAKEEKKATDANLQAQFESQSANEGNREDDRLARTNFLGSQLKGARALSPEVLQAALARRKSSVRKGVAADKSKGMGWGMLSDVAGTVGDLAGGYVKGAGMIGGGAGGGGGDMLSQAVQSQPVSMGGQTFDFMKKKGDF